MDHPTQGGDKDGQFPALLGQDGGISFEDFVSLLDLDDVPYSIWDAAGTGSLGELNSLNSGNQSVAGTAQPVVSLYPGSFRNVAGIVQHGAPTAPAAPEFAYNENQTLSSHDKELIQQQYDQLLVDPLESLPSGPPVASYSMDQFGPLPASRTQLLENQMPDGIQLFIQNQLDPAAEKKRIRRLKKRAADREYRQREKEKKQKLMDENQGLVGANQEKDQLLNALRAQMEYQLQKDQQPLVNIAKAEAKIEHLYHLLEENLEKYRLLEEKLEKTSREKNQLRQKVVAMEKKICRFQKNLAKLCIEKPKKKLKEQVMMAETAEETENDN